MAKRPRIGSVISPAVNDAAIDEIHQVGLDKLTLERGIFPSLHRWVSNPAGTVEQNRALDPRLIADPADSILLAEVKELLAKHDAGCATANAVALDFHAPGVTPVIIIPLNRPIAACRLKGNIPLRS